MSYVVNDDIPKSCSKCPQRTLYHGINVCLAANKMKVNVSNKCRHEKCPLVELPKNHGRLIDVDAFEEKLKRLAESTDPYQRGIGKAVLLALSSEPTIIEAEAGES